MLQIQINDFKNALRKGKVKLSFTKTDNTTRYMEGTLNMDLVPSENRPVASTSQAKESDSYTKIFDLDVGEWRSVRFETIIEWSEVKYVKTAIDPEISSPFMTLGELRSYVVKAGRDLDFVVTGGINGFLTISFTSAKGNKLTLSSEYRDIKGKSVAANYLNLTACFNVLALVGVKSYKVVLS